MSHQQETGRQSTNIEILHFDDNHFSFKAIDTESGFWKLTCQTQALWYIPLAFWVIGERRRSEARWATSMFLWMACEWWSYRWHENLSHPSLPPSLLLHLSPREERKNSSAWEIRELQQSNINSDKFSWEEQLLNNIYNNNITHWLLCDPSPWVTKVSSRLWRGNWDGIFS